MNNFTCRCNVVNAVKKATAGPETQLSNKLLLPDFQFKRRLLDCCQMNVQKLGSAPYLV